MDHDLRREDRPGPQRRGLSLALVIAVSFAVYANTLRNGFVYDDAMQVLQNPWQALAKEGR